ncbi:MAG: Ig-like domain-containing protein [Thiohalomonadaceae bacterium]
MDKRTEDFIATRIPEPNKAKQNNPVVVFLKDLETKMKAWNVAPNVVSVTVSAAGDADFVSIGSTLQLTATVVTAHGAANTVTWATSDNAIATVNDGLVTGVAQGNVTITATSTVESNEFDSITLRVPYAVSSVAITGGDLNVSIGAGTHQFAATVTVAPGGSEAVTWSVGTPGTATIDETTGLLTVATGASVSDTTTVTATSVEDPSKSDTVTVTLEA